ncbi:hypothetical protein AVEN_262703-1 [Araneus ventricosus]|uniref:CCHC-type domain-containing protein n=1 Tax=Araneus ventricosus TaxID=182803 RepID=A0A4Y2HEW0_ARAVE|nr:hypothetical protein AVEN_262703-1 [Araneus ventricosus]
MAFLGKARKEDLIILVRELGEEVTPDLKIIDLGKLIVASTNYETEFVKELLNTVISQRTEKAEQRKFKIEIEERRKREERKREERKFQLEKLKLQNESFNSAVSGSSRPKIDFMSMIPKFDQVNNDISLYLILFERQAQAADVQKEFWASHLLNLLPYEIAQFVAREDVRMSQYFEKKRFPEQNPKFSENPKPEKKENLSTLTCYGCGKPGYIKAKCPSCKPREKSSSNSSTLYTCHAFASPTTLLDIRIGDIHGRACADTGATRSIAGELMFNSLRERGVDFQKMEVTMALADGSRTTMEAYTAPASIDIEGRTVPIEMLALPKAKGNRTLLGTDFLENLAAGSIIANSCHLREDEGTPLTPEQREKMSYLLEKFGSIFKPGGTLPLMRNTT